MTNEASTMGCLYYLISHHGLRTTYTLCGEIIGVKEKCNTGVGDEEREIDSQTETDGSTSAYLRHREKERQGGEVLLAGELKRGNKLLLSNSAQFVLSTLVSESRCLS